MNLPHPRPRDWVGAPCTEAVCQRQPRRPEHSAANAAEQQREQCAGEHEHAPRAEPHGEGTDAGGAVPGQVRDEARGPSHWAGRNAARNNGSRPKVKQKKLRSQMHIFIKI